MRPIKDNSFNQPPISITDAENPAMIDASLEEELGEREFSRIYPEYFNVNGDRAPLDWKPSEIDPDWNTIWLRQ